MNQRKILHTLQNATPDGEGSTALPVSHNLLLAGTVAPVFCFRVLHKYHRSYALEQEKFENKGDGRTLVPLIFGISLRTA